MGGLRIFVTALGVGSGALLWALPSSAAEAGDVRARAEQSFNRLSQQTEPTRPAPPSNGAASGDDSSGRYSPDRYWIGRGQGDLSKGRLVCQRVSELSARTDLAKQIRVMVKEHMVDRVRERSGRDAEQDIELTREELVQEYLQDVRIVERRIDEENHICTATAVMPKTPMNPKSAAETAPVAPPSR